jgi:class 3 adenylate cyclase
MTAQAKPAGTRGDAAAASSAGERRQVTALFADLVDSTTLVDRLDPEDVADVMRGYQRCCERAIDRHEGFVAKYLGDGVVAYFGYPRAHEDEAARALHAAQDILDALAVFARESGVDGLAARIGVATGMVMVRDAETREGLEVYGACPTLAARLQSAAHPNGIVVSETTRRLAGGLFAFKDLGTLRLKGFKAGVNAYSLEGRRRTSSRFAALRPGRATPFVGRGAELAELERLWRSAMDGSGRAVLLAGEPGIGKSRLADALRERLNEGEHASFASNARPVAAAACCTRSWNGSSARPG